MADREDEGTAPQEEPARPPLDEEAAWAALIAGYHADPEPGVEPSWPESENVGDKDPGPEPINKVLPPPDRSIVIHPVISGPRNYELVEDDDDAHFVPPEPPPLPDADVTTKFAWIAVIGGPLLLLAFILLQIELTWWAVLVGLGGFLGGFATLVARMRTGEDDDDLPGGGAVV
ncbi:hypothetical protein GA0115240_11213 [Streptomyces sp. DvalAA-14]|uniref:hypothetical protein n=1 Tax=unclassified Streptomyces TaxID=2593676 RepID=UPI00081B4F34|nr:hypothetical protein [Streptomyces sp. DvalAA-14]MYS19701.1 hypothetical protein [Streptomyces sp. SID4948]SCD51089.1 hypothetical protein GA0115240_11213 [Streptomyces sp. DvalAA-14]